MQWAAVVHRMGPRLARRPAALRHSSSGGSADTHGHFPPAAPRARRDLVASSSPVGVGEPRTFQAHAVDHGRLLRARFEPLRPTPRLRQLCVWLNDRPFDDASAGTSTRRPGRPASGRSLAALGPSRRARKALNGSGRHAVALANGLANGLAEEASDFRRRRPLMISDSDRRTMTLGPLGPEPANRRHRLVPPRNSYRLVRLI